MNVPTRFERPSRLKDAVMWVFLAVCVVAFGGYAYNYAQAYRAHEVRSSDGCLVNVAAPATLILTSDATDPLTGSAPRRWFATMQDAIQGAPPGARIYATNILPVAPTEITFQYFPCIPQPGDSKQVKAIQGRLRAMEKSLEKSPSTKYSAIAETLLAAAQDHDIAAARRKTFVDESDFLQNTPESSAYSHHGKFWLPAPIGRPFADSVVRLVVLYNDRDHRLQTRALIEKWIAWARAGGAVSVQVDCPWLGYSTPNHPNEEQTQ